MTLTKEFGEWERDRSLGDLCYRQLFFFLSPFSLCTWKSKRGLGLREPVVKIFLINSGLALELCFSWHSRRLHLVLLGRQAAVNYSLWGQEGAVGFVLHPVSFRTGLTPYGICSACDNGNFFPLFLFWSNLIHCQPQVHSCPLLLGRAVLNLAVGAGVGHAPRAMLQEGRGCLVLVPNLPTVSPPHRVPSLPSIRLCRIWRLLPRSRFALSAKEGRKINSHQLNSAL